MESSSRPDFLEPLIEILEWFKGLVPTSLKPGRPHFNFITVHYIYLISLSIIGSIILYGGGLLPFIDALFFAAGASTQSGLNTVDVNLLMTYQQVCLMLIACIANPVFINTVVVFIRLHWFEKRFQHIVSESSKARRVRTMSITKSMGREDVKSEDVERGVGGRQIRVLHDTTTPNGARTLPVSANENDTASPKTQQHGLGIGAWGEESTAAESDKSEEAERPSFLGQNPALKRDIVFADEKAAAERKDMQRSADDDNRMPEQRSAEHHIAFLERQRKKDKTTLRIPGPRDFDNGQGPEEVAVTDDGEEIDHTNTNESPVLRRDHAVRPRRSSAHSSDTQTDEVSQLPKREIAFEEPDRPRKSKAEADEKQHNSPRFNVMRPLSHFREKRRLSSVTFSKTLHRLKDARTFSFTKSQDRDMQGVMPYLSWQPTIGRNSAFIDLSEEQREELGGIEYRSLKTLALILVCYFVGFHLLGMIVLLPWIIRSDTWGPVVDNAGQNRVWWGIFTPASMFNDLGFTLTADSMISFQGAVLPLLFGSFLIVIGNTGFPCMLRFVIWVLQILVPTGHPLWEELRFLLDHPRRCFTLLFPSRATWWLFWLLVLLNGLDLIFFIILDLNDETVTALAPGIRVLVGWFQAVSTRTAGFAAVNLANLHPAIQVSYLVMMYISVFPIAISVRRTNVYEEKSLGLWGGEEEDEEGAKSYVGAHLRRQLSFDLWYIFLGLFFIAVIEGHRLENTNDYAFTVFSVLFEIVSAYGTVGLSLGYPNINASFSGEFSVLSKLIIVAMMIRGRHRGLPYALDRAILLPSEALHKKENEEATRRAGRRNSMSVLSTGRAPTLDNDTPDGGLLHRGATGGSAPGIGRINSNNHIHAVDTLSTVGAGPGGAAYNVPGTSPLTHANTSPSAFRKHARRESELSQHSGGRGGASGRSRGIAGLLSAGLSAGPSTPGTFKKD